MNGESRQIQLICRIEWIREGDARYRIMWSLGFFCINDLFIIGLDLVQALYSSHTQKKHWATWDFKLDK